MIGFKYLFSLGGNEYQFVVTQLESLFKIILDGDLTALYLHLIYNDKRTNILDEK